MPEEYPLYPTLSEEGEKEAQLLVDKFKEKFREAATKTIEEVFGDLYSDIVPYIGSDSWANFRNQIMDGYKNYDNRKIQNEFDFKEIRQQIYKEYREDIIKDLDQDNLAKIAELEKHIEFLEEWRNR